MSTGKELIDRIALRLNELSASSPIRWTRSEILVFINDALNELNLISGNYTTTTPLGIDETASIWTLPDDIICPISCHCSGKTLLKENLEDLDRDYPYWETELVTAYSPSVWCPIGTNSIAIVPRVIGGSVIYIVALSLPPQIADDNNSISSLLLPEYEQAIEDFVVSRAMFKEGGAELEQSMRYHDLFMETSNQLTVRNVVREFPNRDVVETYLARSSARQIIAASQKQ